MIMEMRFSFVFNYFEKYLEPSLPGSMSEVSLFAKKYSNVNSSPFLRSWIPLLQFKFFTFPTLREQKRLSKFRPLTFLLLGGRDTVSPV